MKISKQKLIQLIKEEILNILSEDGVETTRDAYLGGSEYAGAGKFIGPGGEEAYRAQECKEHWERWGRWLPGYEDCADMSPRSPQDPGVGGAAYRDIDRDDEQDDRLDDLETRLQTAGIMESTGNSNSLRPWNENVTLNLQRFRQGRLKKIKDPFVRDALDGLTTIISNMNFEAHFNRAVENYLSKRKKE